MKKFTNTLFTGDNLFVLNGMNSETADLIYLDPPFNSKRMYSAPVGSRSAGASFKDMWTWGDVDQAYLEGLINNYPHLTKYILSIEGMHGKSMMAYITYMTQRIIEMHRVLKETGSFYLHCDPTASHYLKVVLDTIFGRVNFRNEIVWHYNKWTNAARHFQKNHDIVLMYAKTPKAGFRKIYGEPTKRQIALREAGYNTGSSRGRQIVRIYDRGNAKVQEKLKSGEWDGRDIYDVKAPSGNPVPDVWDISAINGQSKERTGYPTQKPLALLRRIIQASSDEGAVVLDPFCGCATTCVAAQQLGRKWIGIDIEKHSVKVLLSRLSDDAGIFRDFIHRADTPRRTDIRREKPTPTVRLRLYKKQKGKCNGCGVYFDRAAHLEIDHIIPKSRGGGDYYENYQLLCGNCNRTKGDRPMEYLMNKIRQREKELKIISFEAE